MSRKWQIQEAKNKFCELIEEASKGGAQVITRRGVQVAVVISFDQFMRLEQSKDKLSTFFKKSPLAALDLERDSSIARNREEDIQ